MALDNTSCREIRPLDIVHEFIDGDIRIVDIRADGVATLTEIMRGHVRRHTHCYTGRAVEQQERSLCRKHNRLLQCIVEVILEINSILVYVREHLLGKFLKFCLRIPHCSHRVPVHRAEIALPEDKGISHVPVLGHPRHRLIDTRVPMRMELTQYLAHYSRRLLCLSGIGEAEARHTEKNSPVDRFHAVPHIRKGSRDNHRHRIVYVCTAHLLVNVHRLDSSCFYLVVHMLIFLFITFA